MAFLLDKLKENFGESSGGFDDMNYKIGNTSGMDVGEIPSPLDQRIGRMAQLGGEIMEVQITNPATFEIDRPELINVINSLGLDITLHSEPGIGFTAAYATRGQGFQGYNVVHRYFKRYLEQVAKFKQEVKDRDVDFSIGRINPHASTANIPPLEERIASDVSLDPFGYQVEEVIDGNKDQNIYENKEFLSNLWDYLIGEYMDPARRRRQFDNTFSQFSPRFRDIWRRAKIDEADNVYKNIEEYTTAGDFRSVFEEKVSLIQTVLSIDSGVDTAYAQLFKGKELDSTIEKEKPTDDGGTETVEIETLKDASTPIQGISFELSNPRKLGMSIGDMENFYNPEELEIVLEALEDIIDELWLAEDLEENEDHISLRGKLTTLDRTLDIQSQELLEKAEQEVLEDAKDAFTGDEDHYDYEGNDIEYRDGVKRNFKIIDRLFQNTRLGQQIHKESTVYFNIIPAWMQVASESYDNHDGWDAPEFIWETLIEENYDIDGYEDYRAKLGDRDFRLDVIAAVGAIYIWGHFTQSRDVFDAPELEEEGEEYTWIEWMNKYDIGVNIEAMSGGPGELLRVWRPKDISVACRAINMTAYDELGEDIEAPAKFTIDMEHTASYGVDPWKEMEIFIEQEEELAAKGYPMTDPDKPLMDILKMYHLTKPGFESRQKQHRHGPFAHGDETLYTWLYRMVENGFCRNPDEPGIVMFEVGGEYREEMYVTRVAMDMVELGIDPDDLDPSNIPMDGNYENQEQALIARFFGIDEPNFDREWAKIEEHAFDPLQGLLEAEQFDYTFSSSAALQNDNRADEWQKEEYQ